MNGYTFVYLELSVLANDEMISRPAWSVIFPTIKGTSIPRPPCANLFPFSIWAPDLAIKPTPTVPSL